MAMRSSIRYGAANGNSDNQTENALSGFCATFSHRKIGNIDTSIAGVIMPCASFTSLHAAPIAMNIEPNSTTAITRNSANHGTSPQRISPT